MAHVKLNKFDTIGDDKKSTPGSILVYFSRLMVYVKYTELK